MNKTIKQTADLQLKGLLETVNQAYVEALANAFVQDSLAEVEQLICWKMPKMRWDMPPDEALKDPAQRLAFAVGDYLAACSLSSSATTEKEDYQRTH